MNIDETSIYFDMKSGLTLVGKEGGGDISVFPMTSGSSMRCTVLLGEALKGEKLTPLVVLRERQMGKCYEFCWDASVNEVHLLRQSMG